MKSGSLNETATRADAQQSGKLVAKQVGAVTQTLLEDFIAPHPAR